jgi:6-phosphofructokinase 1
LNYVVHSIVERHFYPYGLAEGDGGAVHGLYNGFAGLTERGLDTVKLRPEITTEWLERGGSEMGSVRAKSDRTHSQAAVEIAENVRSGGIDILYVIGGDGAQMLAHSIANADRTLTVVGVPKSLDNDLPWVWRSFGFDSVVEKATEVINELYSEARSTGRVGLIELMGASSGFLAASAALASGRADLVMIPEEFEQLSKEACENLLDNCARHMRHLLSARGPNRQHGIVVVAEGVGLILRRKQVDLHQSGDFMQDLKTYFMKRLNGARPVEVFTNEPKHLIRSGRAIAHDQIYCRRLGALAVDSALAGYTDCLISQWMTNYVLVPLELVVGRRKRVSPQGVFWRQVCNTTGQPIAEPQARTE